MSIINRCIGCGCTEINSCWVQACREDQASGPCHWLIVDEEACVGVCSQCPESLPQFVRAHILPDAGPEGYIGDQLQKQGYKMISIGGDRIADDLPDMLADGRAVWIVASSSVGTLEIWERQEAAACG